MKKFLLFFCLITTNLFANEIPNLLRIELQGNNSADETVIYFDPLGSDSFNLSSDGVKILAALPGVPSIYTIIDNEKLAINVMGQLNKDFKIPLGLYIQTLANYTITVSDFSSFPPSSMIYIEDSITGLKQNLRINNSVTVSLTPGTFNNRFFIHIHPPLTVAGIVEPCQVQSVLHGSGLIVTQYLSNFLDVDITLINSENDTLGTVTDFSGESDTIFFLLTSGNYKMLLQIDGFIIEDWVTIPNTNFVKIQFNYINPIIGIINTPIIFYATIINGVSQIWDFGDGSAVDSTISTTVSHVYNQVGTYVVKLKSSNGICVSEDSVLVEISDPSGFFSETNKTVDVFTDRNFIFLNFKNVTEKSGDIKIYNITGQCVKKFNNILFVGTQTFEVGDIVSGNYIVTIGNNITKRILMIN